MTATAFPSPSSRPLAVDLLLIAALTLVYAASAVLGLSWSVIPGAGTPIWPGSGIAIAAMILGGVRLWPGVLLGRMLAAVIVSSPQPWWADLILASGTALGAALPAWYARRTPWFDPALSTLSQILLVIAAAVVSAVVSVIPAMAALWASGVPADHLPMTAVNWAMGNLCGVLVVAPILLAWSQRESWRMSGAEALHLAVCLLVVALGAYLVFERPPFPRTPTWYLFPLLVWAALAFNVRGASLALGVITIFSVWSTTSGVGPFSNLPQSADGRLLFSQQFVAITALTMLVLAAVADERRGRRLVILGQQRLREETRALQTLNATGAAIAAELDLDSVVQTVTDAGVELTGAKFGAFFYNVIGPEGESYTLFSLSGAPRSAFERFGMPRNTQVFAPTFEGAGVVRVDDITADPRYGHNAPHKGMPDGHLPVRSYLAVPVKSRSGEVIGGLFFGHSEVGVFSERAEWIVSGIAAQAAIAIDNARLYQAAQAEIAERRRVEERQDLLINELNHRVKNTLATVQSITAQTLRPSADTAAKDALMARIIALSRAHDVITARTWQGADLREVVERAAEPFRDSHGGQFRIEGPAVWLSPKAALAIAMTLHELGTNAAKYGALSVPSGEVSVTWTWTPAEASGRLDLVWTERGGPPVSPPTSRGFGSRMIERGLKTDLNGGARLIFAPEGLVCEITAQIGTAPEPAYFEIGA